MTIIRLTPVGLRRTGDTRRRKGRPHPVLEETLPLEDWVSVCSIQCQRNTGQECVLPPPFNLIIRIQNTDRNPLPQNQRDCVESLSFKDQRDRSEFSLTPSLCIPVFFQSLPKNGDSNEDSGRDSGSETPQ